MDSLERIKQQNRLQLERLKQSKREQIKKIDREERSNIEKQKMQQYQQEKQQDRQQKDRQFNESKELKEAQALASYQAEVYKADKGLSIAQQENSLKNYEINSHRQIEENRLFHESSESEKDHLRQIAILNGQLKAELEKTKIQESYSLERTRKEWDTRQTIDRQRGQDLQAIENIKGGYAQEIQTIKTGGEVTIAQEQSKREIEVAKIKGLTELEKQKIITGGLIEIENILSHREITVANINARSELDRIKTKAEEDRKTYSSNTEADTVAHRKRTLVDMVNIAHQSGLKKQEMILETFLKIIEWEEEFRIFGGRRGATETELNIQGFVQENINKWESEI